MKIPKCIKQMPWPPVYEGGNQDFQVLISWPVVDHERLLVATFVKNVNKNSRYLGSDFRLICSKKNQTARILYAHSLTGKRIGLDTAVYNFGAYINSCYPEINHKEESALGKWLGVRLCETSNHMMPELNGWVREAHKKEIQRVKDAKGELRDEDVKLCPEELPAGLIDAIRTQLLPDDNTLLYKKGNTRGLCYLCGEKVKALPGQRFRQNETTACPNCGRKVYTLLDSSDRFKVDYVDNVLSFQKGTDGKTLFIRQWHLNRDPTAKWENIETHLEEVARYAVRGCKAAKWQHEAKSTWYMTVCRERLSEWTRVKDVTTVYDNGGFFYVPTDWNPILSGTSLQYCDVDDYRKKAILDRRDRNTMRLLMDWARYPALEKFWKAGYRNVVHDRLRGLWQHNRYAINWNKDSIKEAIHFPMRLLKIWNPEEWTMDRMQRVKNIWEMVIDGRIRESEVAELAKSRISLDYFCHAFGHASVHKIISYAESRLYKGWKDVSWGPPAPVSTYRDYLRDCVQLGWNLDDKSILFPKNLRDAHARTIELVKYKKNETKEKDFQKQREKKKWMEWEHDGLLIRMPVNGDEIIKEGEKLHHCVGGYADRAASGVTTILFIRKVEDPDKPFFTLEWLNNHVQQCKSKYNLDYLKDPQVRDFVAAWVRYLARAKRNKNKAVRAA